LLFTSSESQIQLSRAGNNMRRFTILFLIAVAILVVGAAAASWRYLHRPDRLLRLGEEALEHNDSDNAARYADRLETAGYPDHAHLLLGEALLARGQINPAIEQLNQVREDNISMRVRAAATFGLNLLQLNARSQAEQLLKYVVSQEPDHRDAHRGLAALYF